MAVTVKSKAIRVEEFFAVEQIPPASKVRSSGAQVDKMNVDRSHGHG